MTPSGRLTFASMTASSDAPFLAACRGEPTAYPPVWFMRQAGRSLPEYRALRGEGSILAAIAEPEVAAEITLQPVRRYGVDAAIIFSDIVVPLAAIGFGVEVAPGTGPVVAEPFRAAADLARLRPLEPEVDIPYVLETVRMVAEAAPVPVIGFAGAPFTVASYLVEGGPSRTLARTKALMYGDEALWHALLDRLAALAATALRAQVDAGARAVQLFDSWAGALDRPDYQRFVQPHSAKVLAAVGDVPRIHFGVDTGELLGAMAEAGADVVGVDWRTTLADARARIPTGVGVQGNLDPAVCLCPWDVVRARAASVLASNAGRPGHIFNLGHGVLPDTDPDVLARLVAALHEGTLP
jgi:uroporphyrinogen decarboxylase